MAPLLEQVQTQSQLLAPQLRQSLKVLQVSAVDLRNVVAEELQMNPTLEELSPNEVSLDDVQPNEKLSDDEWDSYEDNDVGAKLHHVADSSKHDFLMNSLVADVSLEDHLRQQIGCLAVSKDVEKVLNFLVGSLNDKGFLTLTYEEIERQMLLPPKVIQSAIDVLKQLDPPGVGCSDVRTSLLQQLRLRHRENSLAFTILDQYYSQFLHNRVLDIARDLSISAEAVYSAIREIASLDLAPGRRFEVQHVQSIIPDVLIYKNHLQEWVVSMNNYYIPRLCIGSHYQQLLSSSTLNDSDKKYLRMKMRSGRFLIQSIAHRQKTIERIAYALLRQQRDFFENGPNALKPLTLQTIATEIDVHQTTVSRAVANKFVQTPHGLFGFKYFFINGLNSYSGAAIANTIIKRQIQKVIEQEDKKAPVSDQRIVEILAQNNVQVARRTIAKYRELLGIPPTFLRRVYD